MKLPLANEVLCNEVVSPTKLPLRANGLKRLVYCAIIRLTNLNLTMEERI